MSNVNDLKIKFFDAHENTLVSKKNVNLIFFDKKKEFLISRAGLIKR